MDTTITATAGAPPPTTAVDADLVEQARPGYGVPSQDPRAGAQFPLQPGEAEREAHSVLSGGGAMVGAAAGASLGAALGGPVGALVGGALGSVAGVLGGAAAGRLMDPGDPLPEFPVPIRRRTLP